MTHSPPGLCRAVALASDAVTAEIAAARKEVIHDAAVLANHYRSLSAEIQTERAERQAAREEVKYLAEDVKHLRSWLVTVFLTRGCSWRYSARSWPR